MQFSCGFQQLNKTSTLAFNKTVQPKRSSKLQANRDIYLPGGDATIPDYLDGTLPGDRGFDPLRLCQNPLARSWLANGELYNARWAMLGSVGILVAAIKTQVTEGHDNAWWDVAKIYPFPFVELGGNYVQFPVFTLQWFAFICLELLRIKDWWNPDGSQTSPNGNYPGGNFDPLNFAGTSSPEDFRALQEKEMRNGRLAMASWFAYNAQHYSTGKGPLDNLFDHLADPAKNNITKYGLHPPSLPDFNVQV